MGASVSSSTGLPNKIRSATPSIAYSIRPMEPEDLSFVITEHLANFPEGFFARLGPRYLMAYTRTYLTSPHARAYIVEAGGTSVGFLVGVTTPSEHRKHILTEHGRKLALRAFMALSVRPALALHFIRTRLGRYARKFILGRRRQGKEAALATSRDSVSAVLAHVVVSAQFRSYGLGSALIRRFTQDAAATGCARIALVTAAGPGGAGGYYERLGWHRTGETRTPDGHSLLTYEFPLVHRPTERAE
jgi:ribosomal protein S18 acetylase RimI-like enzyme